MHLKISIKPGKQEYKVLSFNSKLLGKRTKCQSERNDEKCKC